MVGPVAPKALGDEYEINVEESNMTTRKSENIFFLIPDSIMRTHRKIKCN